MSFFSHTYTQRRGRSLLTIQMSPECWADLWRHGPRAARLRTLGMLDDTPARVMAQEGARQSTGAHYRSLLQRAQNERDEARAQAGDHPVPDPEETVPQMRALPSLAQLSQETLTLCAQALSAYRDAHEGGWPMAILLSPARRLLLPDSHMQLWPDVPDGVIVHVLSMEGWPDAQIVCIHPDAGGED